MSICVLTACSAPAASPAPASAPRPAAADPDGEDDGGVAVGPGLAALASAPAAAFERVAPPAGAHPLVCDLAPIAGRLAATFSAMPIDLDGAQVHLLDPATGAWTLALDWDRGGAPDRTREVGGQGITRIRVIDGRLWATDSDAPRWGGFGWSGAPMEDYLFVSEPDGRFPPLSPDDAPPASTRVLPFAFHCFDVIRYRGARVATGGTEARGGGRGTRYPGGLFVGAPEDRELPPRFEVAGAGPVGVVRTTYLHRFRGRLYMGLQNNERRIRWDLAVLDGDPRAPATAPPALVRVTADGGWLTRRFASGGGRLYWIGARPDRSDAALYASDDGDHFRRIALPADAGAPQDLLLAGDTRWLVAAGGLYRAGADDRFARIAPAPDGDPFGRWDAFCSAPLAAAADALWAGSTRDGALWRVRAPSDQSRLPSAPQR